MASVSSRYWVAVRSIHREIALFLAAWFVVCFCYSGLYAVLLNLFALRLGYGPEFVGLMHAGSAFCFAAFALPAGILGRRLGHRRTVLVGLSANTVLSALIPAAVLAQGLQQRTLLLVPYGAYGFFLTFIIVNGVAFLANTSSSESRPLVFSLYTAVPPIAGFFGCLAAGLLPGIVASVSGGRLDEARSYAVALLIVPLLYGATLALFLRSRETGRGGTSPQPLAAARGLPVAPIAVLVLVALLRSPLQQALQTFFNVHLDTAFGTPASVIGLLMSAARLLSAPAALLAPLLIHALGARRTVIVAGCAAALLVLPIAMRPGVAAAAASLVGVLTLVSISNCAFTTFAQETTAPEGRSIVAGAVFTAGGASLVFVSYGGGLAMATIGYRALIAITGALMLAAVLIFSRYFKAKRVEETDRSQQIPGAGLEALRKQPSRTSL